MDPKQNLPAIDNLKIPERVKTDLKEFISQILAFYQDDLLSITAFGSCVTGDYQEGSSDVNLLVVYCDLNIVDLNAVANIARNWLRKRSFAPRFLSRRNLLGSANYFQIDMLEMKDANVVLYGEDLLKDMTIDPRNLHWQLSYEIKAMRSRIKQQFWATSGEIHRVQRVLTDRFTSLIHLSRALLYLSKKPIPTGHRQIMEVACREFGIDEKLVEMLFQLKNNQVKLNQADGTRLFSGVMEIIRTIDNRVDEVKP